MILVDTSVWVDFFHGRSAPHVDFLEKALQGRANLCTCGVILTEVLQGLRLEREYRKVKDLFDTLSFLPMNHQTFILAADIYRGLRTRGVTIRKTLDCMIAAVAIEQDIPLLHHDRDFEPMENHCHLRVPMIRE